MGVHHLRIEHPEAGLKQVLGEVSERVFRGVALPREHRLAGEKAADRETVQPADELAAVAVPDLDAVGEPALVELEEAFDK